MNTLLSFEIAKLLKEKEFNKPIKQRYFIAENIDSDRFPFLQEECALYNWNNYDDFSTSYYSAPTVAEVVMWLYEKHGVWITVCVIGADGFGYWLHDKDRKRLNSDNQGGYWLLPTKAYEAAIKYCLTKLI